MLLPPWMQGLILCQTPWSFTPSPVCLTGSSGLMQAWSRSLIFQTPLTPTSSRSCHLPAACTHPAAFGPSQPVSPHGMEGHPKPPLVSLSARSACPQLKGQSVTSVKHNL